MLDMAISLATEVDGAPAGDLHEIAHAGLGATNAHSYTEGVTPWCLGYNRVAVEGLMVILNPGLRGCAS